MGIDTKNKALCADLWHEYEPSLRKICSYKLSGYPEEIDEVISDTYLALCKTVNENTELQNPKAWLYATLNNNIKFKYTEVNKKKKKYLNFDISEYELFYNVNFDDAEISDEIIDKIKDEILEELPNTERTLFILIYEKKIKLKDIAVILHTTEAAVKQKNYRLKRKIKMIVKEKMKNF